MICISMIICRVCKRELTADDESVCEECISDYEDYCHFIQSEFEINSEYHIVTREMALDAGDIRLEGTRI